jgi:hypothetical protein
MTFTEMQKAHCTAHAESVIDCVDCTIAQQNAACDHLTLTQKAKKFRATKRDQSVTTEAQPVALQTVTHVAGDYPKVQLGEAAYEQVEACRKAGTWACDSADHNGPEGCSNPECFKFSVRAPLQQPLEGVGPSHLSDAVIAKGFILAGNATFTVRSQKTGTRYTYKVSRADCSRCQKKDCQCWKYPRYFVSLLTGPDNTGDYTYLGMLGEQHHFKATRATGTQASGKPFLAFSYVWTYLARGVYPAQVEIWHEGKCGRCGRKLTVPESVERGIGPECAAKGGF